MFWDNRAQSLETQAVGPLHAESEMRGQHLADADVAQELPRRLRAIPAYSQRFAAAFGSAEITEERIAMAIASFERTLARGSSPFDRFMRGEQDALSIAQKRGMVGFFEAGCAKCHGGPMFSDFKVHALGVDSSFHGVADRGDGQGRFRTPSLRNIEKTAPYMHDGSLATLDEVYDFYAQIDRGLDPALSGIGPVVGTARADMTAFLRALTDTASTDDAPTEVPSGLPVGGTRRARR
jgi:cytochrome c peroxidase